MDAINRAAKLHAIPVQSPITMIDYVAAIELLMPLAMGDTSGSRAAAGVLLSAYNANEFRLDVTDLCLLYGDHYNAAIVVIRGRAELRMEPHERIPNGAARFTKIWELWIELCNKRLGR